MPTNVGIFLQIMLTEGIIVDGIKWVIGQHPPKAIPLCPKDLIGLASNPEIFYGYMRTLRCEKCGSEYNLPRDFVHECLYVLNVVNSKTYKAMKFINFDDEAIPIAEEKVNSEDKRYFVTSRLMESKTGLRLVVYAGERGSKDKTQIFVEPEIKRLAFDQKDLHPTEVFAKLEATFADGSRHKMKKGGDEG